MASALRSAAAAVDHALVSTFRRLGKLNAERPGTVIAASLIFSLACISGVVEYTVENRGELLWAPEGSSDLEHVQEVAREFAPSARSSVLLVSAKDGGDVLSGPALTEVLGIVKKIEAVKVEAVTEGLDTAREWDWPSLCAMRGGACSMSSVLDAVGYDQAQLDAAVAGAGGFAGFLTRERDAKTLFSASGGPMNLALSLGGTAEDADGAITSAKVLRVQFTLANRRYLNAGNSYVDPPAEAFEQAVFDEVIKAGFADEQKFEHVTIAPNIKAAARVETSGAIRGDLGLVSGSIMLILVYVVVQLGNCSCIGSRVLLSFGGMLALGLSLGVAYGLGSLFTPYANVQSVLPFLLMGVGADDLFVITNEFDLASGRARKRAGKDASLVDISTEAMGHAGASISATSLTNLLAFLISSATVLPALSWFCVWASIAIVAAFLLSVTMFGSFIVLDARRQRALRADCCPCIQRKDADHEIGAAGCCGRKDGEVLRNFVQRKYAPFLMKPAVKAVVIGLFACITALDIWGATQLEIEFRQEWFVPGDSYLQEYYAINRQYFGGLGVPVGVYAKSYDPHAKQDMLEALDAAFRANKYIDPSAPINNWFTSFQSWLQSRRSVSDSKAMTKADFDAALTDFLADPSQSRVSGDVVMETDGSGNVRISRFRGFYIGMSKATDELDAMLTLLSDIDAVGPKYDMPGQVYASSFVFTSWRQFDVIPSEATQNVGYAILAVFVVLTFFLASVHAALMVAVCVAMALGNVLGLMFFWGVSLDAVSVINLALAVGLAVDYSAHIAHAFLHAPGDDKSKRVEVVLAEMGISVMNGVLSTMLAVLLLSLSNSHIFVVFFKTLFGVALFGAATGLIFLPVILSLIGPEAHAHPSDDASSADAGKGSGDVELGSKPPGAEAEAIETLG